MNALTTIRGPFDGIRAVTCLHCRSHLATLDATKGECEGLVVRCIKCRSAYHFDRWPVSDAEFVNVPELTRQWAMPAHKAGG